MEVARCGLWAPGDRTSARPSAPQTYQCKITQSTGVATKKQREVFLAVNPMEIGLLERKQNKTFESFSTLFLMSTLTWITEKELKKRRRISLEEKHETFIVDSIAAVKK